MLGIKVQKATCDNVFILSFLQEDKSFNSASLKMVENEGINLTYVKKLYPELSNGFRAEEAEVFATNDNYAYFAGLEIRKGSFFNTMQVEKNLAVAVLNETAAYQLFGNYDCVGESIYLDQAVFEVVGIVKGQGNETVAKIYIPDEVAENLNMSCLEIHQLWCQFANVAEAALVIQKMGYEMDEMDIVQMDLYKTVYMQRFLTLLTLAGLALFLYTFKAFFHKTKAFRQDDTIDRRWITKWMLQTLTCMGSLVVTIKVVQLSWCVPPNYELIGKGWKDAFNTILKFYSLSGIELDNMQFLDEWNLLSMLLMIVSVMVFRLFFIRRSKVFAE